jgi:hypothetical protein
MEREQVGRDAFALGDVQVGINLLAHLRIDGPQMGQEDVLKRRQFLGRQFLDRGQRQLERHRVVLRTSV